jgi:hypothetical protein
MKKFVIILQWLTIALNLYGIWRFYQLRSDLQRNANTTSFQAMPTLDRSCHHSLRVEEYENGKLIHEGYTCKDDKTQTN